MPYLLINADDFGLAPGVTEAIIACSASVTPMSTSAMTCIEGAEELLRRDAHRLRGNIGLHLQLTQGKPTLPSAEVPTLLAADGRFPSRRAKATANLDEVAREWREQMTRLRSWGINPDHLDSHHHIHARHDVDERLLKVYVDLALETSLPARSGTRPVAQLLRSKGVLCPDVTIFLSEGEISMEALLHALQRERAEGPREQIVELCCHPGFVDDALTERTLPRYLATREAELDLLLNKRMCCSLLAAGWEIISFSQLSELRTNAV